MSTPRRLMIASNFGIFAAVSALGMGVIHFPMASSLEKEPRFQALGPAAMDLLVLLCLCVGILLLFVGALSLFFARRLRAGDSTARGVLLAMGVLFLARTILELLHPVAIPRPDVRVLIWVLVTSVVSFTAALVGGTRPKAA
jgi:hypothetical protein